VNAQATPGATPQDAQLLAVTPGGQRLHPRITLPLLVRVDGAVRETRDFGIDGFGVVKAFGTREPGETFIAQVSIPLGTLFVTFRLPCQSVWGDSSGVRGVRFLRLTRDQAALLHRIIDDHLAKQVTVIDNVMAKAGAVLPARTSTAQRWQRATRLLGTLTVLLVAAGLLILALIASLFTIRSQVAAVAVEGAMLRAHTTGLLKGPALPPGTHVSAGQVLFSIETPELATQLATELGERDRDALGLAEQSQTLGEVKSLSSNLITLGDAHLASVRAKIAAIDSQLKAGRAVLSRMRELAKDGYVTSNQLDNEQIALAALEATRQETQVELDTAVAQRQQASSGAVKTERDTTTLTRQEMQMKIAEAAASVKSDERALRALEDASQVRSPCDCVVQSAAAKPGDVVSIGTLVYTLRPRDATPVIEALIPAERVNELRNGSLALVTYGRKIVKGRVRKVSYDEPETMRLGLPAVDISGAGGTEQLAKAVIATDERLDAALVGTPVAVYIPGDPTAGLLARAGLVLRP